MAVGEVMGAREDDGTERLEEVDGSRHSKGGELGNKEDGKDGSVAVRVGLCKFNRLSLKRPIFQR